MRNLAAEEARVVMKHELLLAHLETHEKFRLIVVCSDVPWAQS